VNLVSVYILLLLNGHFLMKNRKAFHPLLLVAMAGVVAPYAHALELKDAVEHTIIHSPLVRQKLHQYLGAEAEQGVGYAGFLPGADLSYTSGRELMPAGRQSRNLRGPDSTHERWGWSVNLTQNLFNGYQTLNLVRQQDHAKRAQYYQFLDAGEQQAMAAAQRYLEVLRLRQVLSVNQANLDSHKTIYRKIERKVTAGIAASVDLEQAAGRLALAESNLLTAQGNLEDAQSEYLRVVGLTAQADMLPFVDFSWTPPTDPAAQMKLLQQSPANLAARAVVRGGRMAVDARRGAFLPTVDMRARHEWGSGLPGGRSGGYDRKVFELVSSFNLSRGGADRARLKMASEALNTSLTQRERICRETRTSLSMAANDVVKLQGKISLLQQHALASEKVRRAYQDQFETGKRSLLDVLDSENEWYDAKVALINGRNDLVFSRIRGAAAAGQLLSALRLKPVEQHIFDDADDAPVLDCV
jgi:adhesin transport system outer membrane protein